MNTQIDKLIWHDGNLKRVDIALPNSKSNQSCIFLEAVLYENSTSKAKRIKNIKLKFEGVLRFTSSVNISELAKNSSAGNISDVKFLHNEKICIINLFEGYIEIQFKKVKLLTRVLR